MALNDLCLNLGFVQFELFGREFSQGNVRSKLFFYKGLFACFLFIVIVDVSADFYQIGIAEPTVDGVPCHPIHVIDGE